MPDNDPKAVHSLPRRYWHLFRQVRTCTQDDVRWYYLWECKSCGQRLKPKYGRCAVAHGEAST